MRIAGFMIMMLSCVLGCEIRPLQPVPVGVSGAARDESRPTGAAGASQYEPTIPAPAPGLRGEILFPRYAHFGTSADAIAEVQIDGSDAGFLRSGEEMVYEVSPGVHTFSVQVYRHRRGRQYPTAEESREYVGCSRGRFSTSMSPASSAVLSGIFWRWVIPPPSPMC